MAGDTMKALIRQTGMAALAVALVTGFLVIQHFRHRWPFSLHHAVSVAPPSATRAEPPKPNPQARTHARAPVQLEPAKLASLDIKTEEATTGIVTSPIRAVATVVPDESRVSHVHTRVSGWLEKLYVNTTGQKVKAGEPLAAIFSQELFASQVEFLSALKAAEVGPASTVAASAKTRLQLLGMTDAEIAALAKRGSASRLVTLVAPRSGVVLRRGVAVGTAVDPSTEIATLADLSQVWVLAEVPESEASAIREGSPAILDFTASGRQPFEARVALVYPTLTERTRTLRARFSVPNPDLSLRPGLYGTAEFRAEPRRTLTVSRDAVVDTGTQQHVFVVTGRGSFRPREVQLGARLADRVEIRQGLSEGEKVVSSGVFLIDSESRLRASGGGTGHAGHGGEAATPSGGAKSTEEPGGHGGRDDTESAHPGHGG